MTSPQSAAFQVPAPFGGKDNVPLEVEVYSSLAAAERVWRDFEQKAVLTPYQRFDWLTQLLHAGGEEGNELAIVAVKRGETVLALLPLALQRKLSLTTAHFIGTDQSNSDWIILAPDFAPDREQLLALFGKLSERLGGLDLVSLHNQPETWGGISNPLLQFPHTLAASNFYATTIGDTPKPFIETRLAPKRRGDLKRSRRRMEEAMGETKVIRVNDEPTLERVQATFLEQRGARFDEMGVANIFGDPLFRRLFHDAAISSFGAERPVLMVHALLGGGDIVATVWGTTVGNHYSLYINSTRSGEASKFSLMHILIADLMDELIDMGIKTFDIGLGDFSYKSRWTEPQPVYDGVIALSAKGRLAAKAMAGRTAIKRTIKQNPRLWDIASKVRLALYRLRPHR